jgi:uncharacterized repeat protein (TIGR03803 family)
MNRRFRRHPGRLSTLLFLALTSGASCLPDYAVAQSYTLKTLHAFNGTDYQFPSGVTMDRQGNLYGVVGRANTATFNNNGTIFKYTPAGIFTVIATFDGLDGDGPSPPIVDDAGNLWGTTLQGGLDWHPENNHYGWGTLYKISSTGVFTPGIVEFTGTHGVTPSGSLTIDPFGNLVGAAAMGGLLWNAGGSFGSGTIFQMAPSGVINNTQMFNGSNGESPNAGGAMDSQGNLYGTTFQGGTHSNGTLYKISPSGVYTVLVNFDGVHGKNPANGVAIDSQGNLYGATYMGGVTAINNAVNGYGTIWKWSPTGGLTTLVSFNGTNGILPLYGVTLDAQGNLFGATASGGPNGMGVIYEYSNTGVMSTLVSFDGANNGSTPEGMLSIDSQGDLFGVSNVKGPGGYGTLFEVQPVSTTLSVAAITLNTTTVSGGTAAQGTVTISAPAPVGGMVVTLGSNSSYVTPQGPVTIPAGATSAAFPISTQPVPDNTPVAISARLGISTQQATLTVAPPTTVAVAMVYLDLNGVVGGVSSTGTVLLNRVAPAGGIVVSLSSASVNARVPAGITVPAGAMTATFPITTQPVTVMDDAMITAGVGASSLPAGILLFPATTVIPNLFSFTLNLPTVQGGTPLVGRLFTDALPGNTITFSSSSPAVVVPVGMTARAGEAILNCPFTTTAVTADTVVTITASIGSRFLQTTVTILAPTPTAISALLLNTPGVQGGLSAQGAVVLTSVAPAGGAVIALSSPNSVVGMPSTIGIPEGESVGFFAITTQSVTTTTTAPITATVGGSSQQASLIITPGTPGINVSAITLNSPSIQGGVVGNGFVTLTAPAPLGGAIVTLASSNTAVATVPATVIIEQGLTTGNFAITTNIVSATATTTLSANLGSSTKSGLLTVTPAPAMSLASLAFSPASITSGKTTLGTVTLSAPAPTGGFVVTLGSSDTSVIAVPVSVTVPAGTVSATFTATSVPVASTSMATVTATSGVISKQTVITVVPAAVTLSSLTLSPATVQGGATSQGTATLSNPAPAGGALITLTSSNTGAATLPASVTVPAGAVSATFAVTSKAVTASTGVVLTGTYLGASQTASLTVTSGTSGAPQTDTVSVTKAEYTTSAKSLHVEATSSSKTATMNVLVTSTGALIGSLANDGSGRFKGDLSWASNPQNITLKSSAGGSTGKAVTAK